jgi:CRP-like cAMP-binding protein
MYERLADGNRQIYAFQYPGDICDLHRHVLPQASSEVAVAAATVCSIGTIDHDELDQLITKYPSLGRALWRATVLEASVFQKRLLHVGRQPALWRVAHLLCEQLARQAAVGIDTHDIPLSQIDVADATGLSIVHVNRIFKELQERGFLSKHGRTMKVTNRERLARFAEFDGGYLNMPRLLSRWQLEIPAVPTHFQRSGTAWLGRPSTTGMSTRLVARDRSDNKTRAIPPPS